MYNDELAIVFLVFVVVVISSMVYRIPVSAVSMTLLIGILATFLIPERRRRRRRHTECGYSPIEPTQHEKTLYNSQQMACAEDEDQQPTYSNLQEAENQFSEHDFDVMMHNNLDATKSVYYDMACPGDNALASRMWEQGRRAQQSKDHRAKFDKYSMLHYFDEELRSHANSRWWDNDALEHIF